MKTSKRFHHYLRAGESGDNLVINKGIDTVDVTEVDTDFIGHFYYGNNDSVISDMYDLINDNKPPCERFRLKEISTQKGTYWKFKK